MSHVVKCFRSGNTLRITLNTGLRYSLNAQPGDLLKFEIQATHGTLVTNLSEEERNKPRGDKK